MKCWRMFVRPRLVALSSLVLVGSLSGCALFRAHPAAGADAAAQDRIRITIVGTNDIHGWIEPKEAAQPGAESMIGGADMLGGYLRILRQQRPDSVVLLDAGDLFQGTLVANLTEGAAMIKAFNALGYDAAAVGNHEFDYGPEGEPVVALTPLEDPVGNLKKRIKEAHFPFLTGNIFDANTGEPVDWPNAPQTTIVERQGIRIGVIGLTTPTTPTVTLAENVKGLSFHALVPTTIELARKLRDQGAQIVVVTMHAGAGCPLTNDAHDLSNCEPGELFPYLEALPEGTVDAVVSGHSHQYLAQFVHGVPAIQSKSYADSFGVIELTFDRRAGKLDPTATKIWKPTPLCRRVFVSTHSCRDGSGPVTVPTFLGQAVEPDLKVAAAVEPDIDQVLERKNEKLGPQLQLPFTRSRVSESTLGDLVADVMRENVAGAQVAIMNSGGLRADIERGPVTYGRVFEALPFENHLAILRLRGSELLKMLSRGVSGEHGIIQVSGVQLQALEPKAQPCTADGSRLVSARLADGSPVAPDQTYVVVTNDFIAGGGDGFEPVMKSIDATHIAIRADLPPVREMVVSYFRFHPELAGPPAPTAARIRLVKPACESPSAAR